jgi:ferredoxin-2, mitochondrial
VDRDGTNIDVRAPVGSNLLEVAHKEDIDLEGACEGSLACSTCHVIVEDQQYFDKIPEATDDENDMLDLAFGLTETCAPSHHAQSSDAIEPITEV